MLVRMVWLRTWLHSWHARRDHRSFGNASGHDRPRHCRLQHHGLFAALCHHEELRCGSSLHLHHTSWVASCPSPLDVAIWSAAVPSQSVPMWGLRNWTRLVSLMPVIMVFVVQCLLQNTCRITCSLQSWIALSTMVALQIQLCLGNLSMTLWTIALAS